MSVTEKQLNLADLANAKVLQTYGESKFCTVVQDNLIYLLNSTIISRYNTIATIDVRGHVEIYDRDKANIFVDWSHEHYGKKGNIEDLSNEQIGNYIYSYIAVDTTALIKFNNTTFTEAFKNIIDKFSAESQLAIFDGLMKMGVYANGEFKVPYARLYNQEQADWSNTELYSFIKLDAATQKYDICSRTDDEKAIAKDRNYIVHSKNGNIKKIFSDFDNKLFVIFNSRPKSKQNTAQIEEQVRIDVEGSSYAAANKFVVLECKFCKSLEEVSQAIANKQGYVDLAKVHQPEIDPYAELIAKTVRAYKRLDDTKKTEKEHLINVLVEAYSNAYKELQKAQDSLKELYKFLESLN